jgi:alkanesulfonate monooxygenase SsuD/methylene tetrahydromethanopterin reductase-like flavin-dependent oxidoreductase (luciferase family)
MRKTIAAFKIQPSRANMQIGYATTFQNPNHVRPDKAIWDEEVHLSDLAVELGYDSIWSTEHHFTEYEMIPNPLQFLTFMAGRSKTIRLGTMVVVLPWHDPLRVVEEVTVLDNLSDGRLILGIGRGACQKEFDGMRIPMGESRGRFNEAADVVLAALETGYIESKPDGFFKIPRRDIRPQPLYSFRGRTFGAGGSTNSMAIMAGLGLGLLIVPNKTWDEIDAEIALYDNAWAEKHPNRVKPQHLLDQFIFVDKDASRAKDIAYRYIGLYFREILKHYDFGGSGLENTKGYEAYKEFAEQIRRDEEKMINQFIEQQSWGTPEQLLERLDVQRKRLNASTVLGHFSYGGMPLDVAEGSMRLFAKECIPAIKSWGVPDVFAKKTPLHLFEASRTTVAAE